MNIKIAGHELDHIGWSVANPFSSILRKPTGEICFGFYESSIKVAEIRPGTGSLSKKKARKRNGACACSNVLTTFGPESSRHPKVDHRAPFSELWIAARTDLPFLCDKCEPEEQGHVFGFEPAIEGDQVLAVHWCTRNTMDSEPRNKFERNGEDFDVRVTIPIPFSSGGASGEGFEAERKDARPRNRETMWVKPEEESGRGA